MQWRYPLPSVLCLQGQGGGGELDTRGMRGLVQGLPQYREQLARLGVHVEMGSRMNRIVEERRLQDLAKLEQVCRLEGKLVLWMETARIVFCQSMACRWLMTAVEVETCMDCQNSLACRSWLGETQLQLRI